MSPQDAKSTKYEEDDDEYTFDDLDGFDLDSIPWLCATQPATQDQQSSQSHQLTAQPADHSTPQNAASALPHVVDATSSHELSSSTLPESSAAPTETVQGQSSDSTERSTTPSTDYGLEDDVDDEFLKAVDKLETELLSQVKQSTSAQSTSAPSAADSSTPCPTNLTATTSRSVWQTNGIPLQPQGVAPRDTPAWSQQREPVAGSTPQKRQLSEDKNETKGNRIIVVSPQQAGRDEDGRSQKKVKQLLEDFEEEISCPICFDLFACAYLFNPCGHSYCGECALGWMEKNKDSPVCAVCRTRVNKRGSMIANIALDNAVQRHVDALAENGDVGWKEGGEKRREWMLRKEEWKIGGIKRMADVMKTRKSRRK